jgi:hypothetical protein
MQPTTETKTIEAITAAAERQRQWLLGFCWTGLALALTAVVFVVSYPLFARWQLRRQGWELDSWTSDLWPWSPRWKWAEPWFGPLDYASLKVAEPQLSDLSLLYWLSDIIIEFESNHISESSLKRISQLPNVTMVSFSSVKLECAGLRHLANSPNLEALAFGDMRLFDRDLECLADCHQLARLYLTAMADDHVKYLSRLHRLQRLDITDCRFTDEGARQLADVCPHLEVLSIHGASFSNAAVAEFARLPKLEQLDLSDVPITDVGLLKLTNCTNLKWVNVRSTNVTSAGAAELRKSLTGLKVSIE